MSYPINYPTPQGANVQIFREGGSTSDWVKPQGASFVWFTLIGAGGRGGQAISDASAGEAAGGGGGTGAVTNFMCPAFLIPDVLAVSVADAYTVATTTQIAYQQKTGTGYVLLTANRGTAGSNATSSGGVANNGGGGSGGTAMTANAFTAMGFFQSIAGSVGSTGNNDANTPTTTFLQSGPGGKANGIVGNYGYGRADYTATGESGYGLISPIIASVSTNKAYNLYSSEQAANEMKAGFGSGGGGARSINTTRRYGAAGGDGLVVIITW
jgi:hypothetical protein